MEQPSTSLGLEGIYEESELPLLVRRSGMVEWDEGIVRILDRRKLPHAEEHIECRSTEDVAVAIEGMVVQGAFTSAIAAGYGLALWPKQKQDVGAEINSNALRLIDTRPTGLALRRMVTACLAASQAAIESGVDPAQHIVATVDQAATNLAQQGWKTGQRIASLLEDGSTILTHCFPDRSYVYMLMEAAKAGKNLKIICSETRPYLQGARLTSLCAQQAGFDTALISDGMGGFLMRRGDIDVLITAADRVCMDGTICNKIGTYQYALAANTHNIPYYVLRQSGPDLESANEDDIDIEERSGDALLYSGNERVAPEGVCGIYPSFDITPPELIHRIVTDRGVFAPSEISSYAKATSFISHSIL